MAGGSCLVSWAETLHRTVSEAGRAPKRGTSSRLEEPGRVLFLRTDLLG
jgi:hypothetical protein